MASGMAQDAKSLKLVRKLKADGLSKVEIDKRLKQSLIDRRTTLQAENGKSALVRKKQYARLKPKTGRRIVRENNTYLLSVGDPENHMSIIPDLTTFPRATIQVRTVGTMTTNAAGAGTMYFGPSLNNGGEITDNAIFTYDASTVTKANFNVHGYGTSLANNVGSYRVVSMCVNVKYIGSALNNQGQCAIGCMPPTDAIFVFPTNFSEVAEYNYAAVNSAAQGAYQIWMPAGAGDFAVNDFTATRSSQDTPVIAFAVRGCQVSAPVFNVTWTMNIEAFSFNQLLTATKAAGKPDPQAFNSALAAVASAHMAKGLNGPADSGSTVLQSILGAAQTAGSFLWENRAPIMSGIGMLAEAL